MARSHDPAVPSSQQPFAMARAAVIFAVIAVLAGADAVTDLRHGLKLWNVGLDLAITTCALGAGAYYWWQFVQVRRHAQALLHRLADAHADAERWRIEAASVLPALGAAIQRQLERWALTPDEQHVALLLLGGLSSKSIAEMRHSDAAAVRQQTLEIYRKAGFSGRAALSAFFLQDLLFLTGTTRTTRGKLQAAPSLRRGVAHWN